MTIFGQELAANRSGFQRFFVAVLEICRSGSGFFARIVRIHRDRATLDELPDYLLRDIGIARSEIRSITRRGRGERSA
ncbi:hypothetical protein ORS3428_19945 [Mesorhizobium sp. ORS 3428]|nr:hypothetical protein ORS3428_19945 [Mesorhizobium sp. ORS 3428]